MADDAKKLYKKPEASDVGKSASVVGAGCSPGINQSGVPACQTTGSVATSTCERDGVSAGTAGIGGNCWANGTTANHGECDHTGVTAKYYNNGG